MNLFEESMLVLEWPKLLDALAQQARSTVGVARCRSLRLASDVDDARRRQQETTEMARLVELNEPLPTFEFPDIREPLARAKKGASLETHELRDCLIVLELLGESHRYFSRRHIESPALAGLVLSLGPAASLRPLQIALETSIQPDGSIKESATPELRWLTHHAQDLKQDMRQRLEGMLHADRYEELLQEQYFAQREGRYVLPIKADMRGRVPGIVHDVSASGATVFIEPRELVELNNSIKVADLEIDREVRRILRELSALAAAEADLVAEGLDVLANLDCIAARAAFARRLDAHPVNLHAEGRIRLRRARHPLLMLSKAEVVANDIVLDDSVQVLVISGPNTGGKTVTLKIVGLFALMARAGLHLPCDPESEMAIFSHVYADIGDAQDLARDLSSFSAHMTKMIQFLRETAEPHGTSLKQANSQTLVLLDEPVTSTDPNEGAALAEALLCRLAALDMKVIATTHYGALKSLAHQRPEFANAAVEFDVPTLSPTYRLFIGVPGGSSAIEIARRLGMDRTLLDDARSKLNKNDQALETMLADLQSTQRRLADDLVRAVEARQEAEAAARQAKEQVAQLEATEQEARKGIKKKLSEQFSRARAEVQATVEAVKREQKLIKAKEATQRLLDLEAQTRAELAPTGEPIPLDQLSQGDQVEIGGLGMTGTLLDAPQGKKRVRVKVGEGEVLATVSNLIGLARSTATPVQAASAQAGPKRFSPGGGLGLDEQTVLDVRGKAAEDALDAVVAALDRATLDGAPFLRIIHGHGTGKLKVTLREYLKNSPYVSSTRPGDRAEGGDGVTVVQLR